MKQKREMCIRDRYGADTSPAEHKLPSVMWSQEYQVGYLEMCHRVFDSYDFVAGELAVSYTHLDVYKRQHGRIPGLNGC